MAREELPPSVRLDKWLWAARFFKSRSAATTAVAGGKAAVNGEGAKPAHTVRPGDKNVEPDHQDHPHQDVDHGLVEGARAGHHGDDRDRYQQQRQEDRRNDGAPGKRGPGRALIRDVGRRQG